MSTRLGELLVRRGLLTAPNLAKAAEEHKTNGTALSAALVKLGCLGEAELAGCLQKEYHLSLVDPSAMNIPPEVLRLIPFTLVQRHHLLPINLSGSSLTVAMSDPSNIAAINEVKFLTGYDVKVTVACVSAVESAITQFYEQQGGQYEDLLTEFGGGEGVEFVNSDEEIDLKELERATEDAPVVRLVNAILTSAIKRRASDVHLEPYEKIFRVRLRVDGVLEEIMRPPVKLKNAITSRVKVMASLDIAERRLPQDGRIKLKLGRGQEMDFRVSVLPTIFGEKIVLRLLDKSNLQLDMTKLGFEEAQLKDFKDSIYKPFGMVLVTGPTGSGKTTTLYSALSELNKIASNISTAEDPVEFNLPGHQPGADPRGYRAQLRRCAALVPAAGPGHHHGRRGARLRDGGDQHQGGPHRPPRAQHAAHERRAVDDQPPPQHGRRAVPGRVVGESDPGAAPGAGHLHELPRAGRDAAAGVAGHRRPPRRRRGLHVLSRHRLPAVRWQRLSRPHRPVRGHAAERGAARASPQRRLGRRRSSGWPFPSACGRSGKAPSAR